MELQNVIKNMLVTEKVKGQEAQAKYLFAVDMRANKIDIKNAIEHLYKVKVKDVNTINVHGKMRRVRHVAGLSSRWKKAYVTLKQGEKIEIK
ncbi:MAG: 50S ribosomal protein L23 [Candidatus Omnitrophota bacterium]